MTATIMIAIAINITDAQVKTLYARAERINKKQMSAPTINPGAYSLMRV
jgi:hypothetical protein